MARRAFSQRWAAMLGHDLATLTPHVDTWTRHVHPDDLPQACKALDDHGALTDITARKEMELALHAREAKLREALAANEALVQELRQALDRVRTLADLLPLCMHCRKVRDDDGDWAQIEEYVASHTDTSFSHGICPECLRTHDPEYPQ
ncbi:PAS domain-containing protein [Luteitalea sp.]|uniref:PAS domain-containing protein n=1 Tax=Luteitalea sp. TaxID=2004800 RepID=UPI0025B7BFDB|nr:PAS domain-containing protein [Luteitalea sp.]